MAQPAKQAIQFGELIDSLQKYETTTSFEAQDLTAATYRRDSEFGSLEWTSGKYELSEWSARQVCRLAGIPFGVFCKASETLSQDMFKEFTPGVKEPQVKLAIKTFGPKRILRGVLSVDYPDVRNSEVLGSLESINEPFDVESASWMDVSSPIQLRTRVTFPNFTRMVNNEELKIGLDVTSSELGACPMQVNVLLYRTICANGAIASYGRKPYFYYDYSKALVIDVADVFSASMKRVVSDVDVIMDRVRVATQSTINMQRARVILMDAVKEGALNKGVVLKTLGQLEKDGVSNVWDFVNGLTAQARGFRDTLRLKYEAAAGKLLGLSFDRNSMEDAYAVVAKEIPLLQEVN